MLISVAITALTWGIPVEVSRQQGYFYCIVAQNSTDDAQTVYYISDIRSADDLPSAAEAAKGTVSRSAERLETQMIRWARGYRNGQNREAKFTSECRGAMTRNEIDAMWARDERIADIIYEV